MHSSAWLHSSDGGNPNSRLPGRWSKIWKPVCIPCKMDKVLLRCIFRLFNSPSPYSYIGKWNVGTRFCIPLKQSRDFTSLFVFMDLQPSKTQMSSFIRLVQTLPLCSANFAIARLHHCHRGKNPPRAWPREQGPVTRHLGISIGRSRYCANEGIIERIAWLMKLSWTTCVSL